MFLCSFLYSVMVFIASDVNTEFHLPTLLFTQALEAENATKHSYLLELQRTHEEERKKSRRYLHALEQENEVRPFMLLACAVYAVLCCPL
jgi:hypothetical protein